MNHVYRLVFNAVLGAFVVVSEITKGRKKDSRSGKAAAVAAVLLSAGAAQAQLSATALPQGAQLAAGQASVSTTGAAMSIQQSSARAALNWQNFNIGSQATVNITQPGASSVLLNRVTGGDPSQILGSLHANGQVFLVNPNGVMFGQGSRVNVGALVASTLDIGDADFMAGNLRFNRANSTASVHNQGTIEAGLSGYVAMLAPSIQNEGVVTAQRGTIAMVAGEAVTLSLTGSGSLSVQVDPAQVQTQIDNRQLVQAEGGQVVMTARAASSLIGASINNSGTISASSLVNDGGIVRLVADHVANAGTVSADGNQGGHVAIEARQHDAFGQISAVGSQMMGGIVGVDAHRTVMLQSASIRADGATDGGTVRLTHGQSGTGGAYLSGRLSADGAVGRGGDVQITGRALDLFGTHISATGATGGGQLRVGGDYQGGNAAVPNAQKLDVNAASVDVSATQNGTGGQAIFWSEDKTLFAASVDARGASNGIKSTATGGLVEVSSRGELGFGGTVQANRLLLDPSVLNIIEPGMGFEMTNFVDPDAATSGFGTAVYDVSNTDVLVLSPNQSQIGSGAGYVFQRNGTLVSALRDTGGVANWRVLGSDRYLIANTAANGGLGAVSYFNALSATVNGRMDASNSLVGDGSFGRGFGNLYELGGGYYGATVRTDLTGLNSLVLQKGAWNFFKADASGTNLVIGTVSAGNSLVGSTAGTAPATDPNPSTTSNTWVASTRGDAIGFFASDDLRDSRNTSDTEPYVSRTLTSLGNGNWIMGSPLWNGITGGLTFISPQRIDSGAIKGVFGSTNSLVGSAAGDNYGISLRWDGRAGVGLLQIGGASSTNYILNINSKLVPIDAASAAAGIAGTINAGNSLVVADGVTGITQLSTGDIVLTNSAWGGNKGYVRVLPYAGSFTGTFTGTLSAISSSNSLVGAQAGDSVGSSIIETGGGYFLARSAYTRSFTKWTNQAGSVDLGALTYMSASAPVTGVLSSSNSLLGRSNVNSAGGVYALGNVTTLSDGSYVVVGTDVAMSNGTGLAVFGAAGVGVHGQAGPGANSVGLYDATQYSGLRTTQYGGPAVTDLGGGAWVIASPWLDPSANNWSGDPYLVWGSNTNIPSGQVTTANTFSLQNPGSANIGTLGSGNFVVGIPNYGINASEGAITVINANSASIPTLTSANALLGSSGDHLGAGITALGNNRYAILSPDWNGGYGAVNLVDANNALTRLAGSITTANSFIGSAAGDRVGSGGLSALGSSGVSALISENWSTGKGAVTLFNTASGDLLGTLSSSNSLVGRTVGDHVGLANYGANGATAHLFSDLGGGRFAMRTAGWLANAGDGSAAGALTWINTAASLPAGIVNSSNSLVGASAGDVIGADGAGSLFTDLGGGDYALRHAYFGGNKGAMTIMDRTSAPVGVVGVGNSLVNTSTATGVFDANNTSLVQLGSGYVLMTPTWGSNQQGAMTYLPTNSTPNGAISSSTSLIGGSGDALGGKVAMFTNSQSQAKLLIGSPLWNGMRGAATLIDNTNGLVSTLLGTLDVDATNSFVGSTAGDRVSSGGVSALGNDIYVVQSPDFGSTASVRTIYGAVTLGDTVTNALKGDVSSVNSFFSSISGQSAAPYLSAQGQTSAILSTGSEVGLIEVVQPVSLVGGGLVYGDYGARRVNMRPMTIEAVLNTGTNLTLQATNAINLYSPITVNNTTGNGGHLTLQTSSTSGAITIGSLGRITTDNGELTIISAGSFINNASATPFNTGSNRWTVYANDPATSSLGTNLNFDFKEYGKTFGQTLTGRTVLGANTKGVVFVTAPTLSVPTPNDSKTYDGTTALGTPVSITGLMDGDLLDHSFAYTDIHADPNWNQKDIVFTVGNGGLTSSVATGRKPVFGYLNQPTAGSIQTFTGAGFIMPFSLQLDLAGTTTKVYDGTDAAVAGYAPQFSLPGFQQVAPDSGLTFDSTGMSFSFASDFWGFPNSPTGLVSGHSSGNGAAWFQAFGSPTLNVPQGARYLATDYQVQLNNNVVAATITPRPLASGLTVSNKVYDGNATATVSGGTLAVNPAQIMTSSYNSSGGSNPDDVQISGTAVAGAANFSNANAATGKTVTINLSGASLNGADAENYTITSTTTTANITPKALSITGSTVANKQYDGTAAATINVGTLSGFVGSETLTAAGAGTFAAVNVGNNINVATTYSLTNGTNGGLASNYSLAPETLTGNITPAWLAVIVGSLTGNTSKVYDGSTTATLNAGNFLLTGWVNGDGSDVTVTKTSGVFADKNVGTNKLVTVSLASGDFSASGSTLLSNYGLPTTASGNIGEITAKALTANYTGTNRVYNALTSAAVTGNSSDIISGDTVTFSQSATFADKNVGTGKTVNVTGISLGGTDAGNYALQSTTASTTADITAKALTASYTGTNRVYNALTGAIVTGTSSDIISGDTVTFSQSAAFTDKNVGTGKTVNVTSISLGGSDAGNYALQSTTASTTANITQASLSVSGATAANRVYDGTTSASVTGGTVSALGGDSVSLSAANATFGDKNVGTAKAVTTAYTLSGSDAANYSLVQASGLTADITAKALTASYTGTNRVYNALTGAIVTGTSSDIISGDTVTFSQSAAFTDKNVGTGKTVNVTSISLGGSDAGNYALQSTTASTTANITQASLSVSGATAANRVYDGTTSASVTGGTVSALGSDSVSLSSAHATFGDKNVGTGKAVSTAYTLSGSDAANYSLVQASGLTADITAKALTASYTGTSRVYNALTGAIVTGTSSDILSGDTVTFSQSAAFTDKNVGTGKTVNVTSISLGGADAGNYALQSTTASATANITPFVLSIGGITASNKVYDGTTAATLSGTASLGGVLGSDVVSVSGTVAGTFSDKNVGAGKSIGVSGLSLAGTDAGNYSVGALSATADITPKALTASYAASHKVYDASTAATVVGSSADVLSGDAVTFSQSAAFADKNVGTGKTVNVTGISLGGADAGNYSLQNTTASTTANITAKALTASYTASNKVYDATTSATVVGGSADVINGDTVTFSQSAAFTDKNVGTGKTVNVSGISLGGTDAGNYSLQSSIASTTANITQVPLSVLGANAANKVYDGSVAASVTGGSVTALGSDTLTLSGANAVFADKNVGVGKAVTTAYTLSGTDAANYVLSQPSVTANITPKQLTVTGLAASDKTYDGTNAVTMANWGSVTTGIGSETLVLNHGGASFSDANAATGKTVTVSGFSLADGSAGGLASNYLLTSTSGTATASIARAPLTMTAQNATKAFSDTDPTLNVVYSGFVGSETSSVLSGISVSRVAGEAAGSYAITPTASATNYSITPVNGTFTIAPADQLVIQLGNISMVYGSTPTFAVTSAKYYSSSGSALRSLSVSNNNGLYTVDDGLGTTASFSLAATGTGTSTAGYYRVGNHTVTGTGFQLLTGSNFNSSSFSVGNMAVSRLAVDLTDSAGTGRQDAGSSVVRREYDGTTAVTLQSLANIDNLKSGDVVSLNTGNAVGAYADAHAGNGKLATFTGVTLAGADANNYAFSGTLLAEGKVDPRELTWTGVTVQNRTYDATTNATVSGYGVLSNVVTADLGQVSVDTNSVGAQFTLKDAGTNRAVTVWGNITGSAASDYALNGTTAYADIARAQLQVTGASAANKVYDGTTAATVTGGSVTALGSDVVTLSSATNATFANKNVGTGKAVTTAYTLSGADAGNYSLVQASGLTANITAKALTASYTASNKVYDATTSATVVGSSADVINGDSLSFSQSAAFTNKNVGTGKTVNVTGISLGGADAGNYSLQNTTATSTANITPFALGIGGITASNKVYDGTTAAALSGTASLSGVLGSDVVNVSGSAIGTFADKNVGTGKSILVSGLSLAGADAGNYSVGALSATADITAKALTVNYTASNKVYDATTAATVVGGSSDVVSGDAVTFSQSAAFVDKNVGAGKMVNVSGISLSGTDAGNYSLQNTTASTTANITAKTLSVSYSGNQRVYDGSTTATVNETMTGLLNGDTVSISETASFADKNVGTGKAINISGMTLGGSDAGNYVLTSSTASTSANITAKALTASYTASNKVYDATASATVAGSSVDVIGGDTVTFSQSAAFTNKNVGTGKTVNVTGISLGGADAGNYSLQNTSASTTADITARLLALSGLYVNAKNYDGSTAATFSGVPAIAGILPGDVAAFSGTAAGHFATAAVGAGQTVTLAASTLNGLDALNYALPTMLGDILTAPSGLGQQAQLAVNGLLSGSNAAVSSSWGSGMFASAPTTTGSSSSLVVPGSGFGTLGGSGSGIQLGASSINLTAVAGGMASTTVIQSTLSVGAGSASVGAGARAGAGASVLGGGALSTALIGATVLISAAPGVQLQSTVLNQNSGFVEVKSFAAIPVALTGAAMAVYSLPQDTFVHAVQGTKLSYSAKQADGSPLPEWARFNTATGEITLNPPAGLVMDQLYLTITAVDTAGNSASSNLQFKIGQ